MSKDIYKSDYDFNLPNELIAQHPLKGRTDSLLMHVDGNDFNIKKFTSISTEISKNDCLIVNETKVIKRLEYPGLLGLSFNDKIDAPVKMIYWKC